MDRESFEMFPFYFLRENYFFFNMSKLLKHDIIMSQRVTRNASGSHPLKEKFTSTPPKRASINYVTRYGGRRGSTKCDIV